MHALSTVTCARAEAYRCAKCDFDVCGLVMCLPLYLQIPCLSRWHTVGGKAIYKIQKPEGIDGGDSAWTLADVRPTEASQLLERSPCDPWSKPLIRRLNKGNTGSLLTGLLGFEYSSLVEVYIPPPHFEGKDCKRSTTLFRKMP